MRQSGMPWTRPEFRDFVVDDRYRIGVLSSAATDATVAACIFTSLDGTDLAVTGLPLELTLQSICGGRLIECV